MISLRRGVAVLALLVITALSSAAVTVASGTDKPEVQTQPATQLTGSTARLNAKVKPRGLATTWWFEYGTTKSYGQSTLAGVGLLGSDWASVVSNIAGLAPNTTYHYRIVASNLKGQVNGGDKTFKTGSADGGTPGTSDPGDDGSGDSSGSGSDSSGSGSDSGDDSGDGSGDDSSGSSGSGSSGSGSSGSGSSGSGSQSEPGHSVSVEPEDGTVRVKEPGDDKWGAIDSSKMPNGTLIDATNGKVTLTTATIGGKTQTASFWGGVFAVTQDKRSGYTDIHLRGASLADCPTKSLATASKKRRGSSLWGSDKHGRYRTHGRNSVATVRGTTWKTTDRCGGTLTFVRDGAVAVRDLHRHRTVLVRAGHAYLARSHR
jgi:hypothetical protein